jgi:hypothetical protein
VRVASSVIGLVPLGLAGGVLLAALPAARPPAAGLAVTLTGGKHVRVLARCPPDTTVAFDAGLATYGARPTSDAAAALLARRDATVSCLDAAGTPREAYRTRALELRAISPALVKDAAKGDRLVLTVDGAALGPRVAPDDGVYLVWRGEVLRLDACPDARPTDERLVACAPRARLEGRGAARVRVQAAGRLVEAAGAPLDLPALLARGGGS